jgi:hypothetical protein
MPGHKNKAISMLGKKIAMSQLHLQQTDISPTGLAMQKGTPCKVFTKTFDMRGTDRVTGKDERALRRLQSSTRNTDCFIVFVDAAVGGAYGGLLSILMRNAQYHSTHSGNIVYFELDKMQSLFTLAPEERETLVKLISDNASDKNQIKLF